MTKVTSVAHHSLRGRSSAAAVWYDVLRMSKHIEDYRPRLDVINKQLCDRHRKLNREHNKSSANYATTCNTWATRFQASISQCKNQETFKINNLRNTNITDTSSSQSTSRNGTSNYPKWAKWAARFRDNISQCKNFETFKINNHCNTSITDKYSNKTTSLLVLSTR